MRKSQKEKQAEAMFNILKKNINKEVEVFYSDYGRATVEKDVLKEVNDFHNVVVGCTGIPFVGYGCAIHFIRSIKGECLYLNRYLEMPYDRRMDSEVDEARKMSFGNRIVKEEVAKREEYKRQMDEFLENAAREAKRDKLSLQKEGLALIKPETAEDWIKFTENNCNDGYSCVIVRAVVAMMKKMEEGVPFKEAETQVFSEEFGLTGFQAGAAANCLSHFAKQGEEFRKYWNSEWGVSEEEKGVVNPAVITVGPKR